MTCQRARLHPSMTDSPCIHPCVLALDTDHGLRRLCLDDLPHTRHHQRTLIGPHRTHIVIITVRTILVAVLVVGHVLAKRLFALFAGKRHLCRLGQSVVLRFCVALCTVKPLLAAWCAYRHLCVQDMFAAKSQSKRFMKEIELETRYRPHRKRALRGDWTRLPPREGLPVQLPNIETSSDA